MTAAMLVVTGIRDASAVDLLDMVRRGEHHTHPIELGVSHTNGSLAYGARNARRNPRSVKWLQVEAVTVNGEAIVITAAGRHIRITNTWAPLVVRVAPDGRPVTR